MKRICLFSGNNEFNYIQQYVIDYVAELSKYSDVYYLGDRELNDLDILKLEKYCKKVWGYKHGKSDLGSYASMAKNLLGWEFISQYEELLLVNDSCFLLQDLGIIFAKMNNKDIDSWSLLATDENNLESIYAVNQYQNKKTPSFCLGTYFIAFRKKVITNYNFQEYWDKVLSEDMLPELTTEYEILLTEFLKSQKYNIDCSRLSHQNLINKT